MIKDFTPRIYQEAILATAAKSNTLIVLPTGLGKTNIFLMIAAHRLRQHPDSKILLIGPTKPLIEQYLEVFKKHFEIEEDKIAVLTGLVSPEKRAELWNKATIIFSTPQGLENDILSNKISLENISLLGIDEAHRAVGNYSYAWIAKRYWTTAKFPRITGMTASPGSDTEKIAEVCTNLMIEEIEVRTEDDEDVKPYIQQMDIDYVKVDLPERLIEVKKLLENCLKSKTETLKKLGYLKHGIGLSKSELLAMQAELRVKMAQGERDFMLLKSISILAEIMKASHAAELLETQGIEPLHKYFQRMQEEGLVTTVKALKNLLADENFKAAMAKTQTLYDEKIEHPKIEELKRIVAEAAKNNTKTIVFSHYRDTALKIRNSLNTAEGIKAEIFVGQAKKQETGLSQKKQKELLDKFRNNEFNTLVATSIGEEGLDIIKVELVIFYEPVPSAIRAIQRRGRTARQEKGKVIVLITRNTRDEAFRWVAHHKEKRMHRILKGLKGSLKLNKTGNKILHEYKKTENTTVIADHREKGAVSKELSEKGITVELKTLSSGDYLCSSRAAVEVKKVEDFVNSIIDGRLLQQLRELKRSYEKPLVIIEGREDIYTARNIHPNAIQGMLATIAIDYGIPIIKTNDAAETAGIIAAIARREQEKGYDDFQLHNSKPLTIKEIQEYIVSSFPGVELTIAKSLLKQFGSVKGIVNADTEALKKAEPIGEKRAAEIRRALDTEYQAN